MFEGQTLTGTDENLLTDPDEVMYLFKHALLFLAVTYELCSGNPLYFWK